MAERTENESKNCGARSAFLFCLLSFLSAIPTHAHPVHATFAEAVWNPKTRSIEVALRVRGLDLEAALSKGREKSVDLDKTEEVDTLISDYLNKNFTVQTPAGDTLRPKWADKEVGLRNTWLYFEFPLGESLSPSKCKVTNCIFFDDLDGQKNVIEYREGTAKRILAFEGEVRQVAIEPAAADGSKS